MDEKQFIENSRVITGFKELPCQVCQKRPADQAIVIDVTSFFKRDPNGAMFPLAFIPMCNICANSKKIEFKGYADKKE